jgi:hypothetical protein
MRMLDATRRLKRALPTIDVDRDTALFLESCVER